jgi:hypothetical protein
MIGIKKLWEAMPPHLQRKVSLHDLKQTVDAYNATGSEFVARMVECMKIQNAKNEAAECAEWIAQDREFAMKTALNQVTAGIGTMVMAGVDPEELLTRWMDAVHRHQAGTHAPGRCGPVVDYVQDAGRLCAEMEEAHAEPPLDSQNSAFCNGLSMIGDAECPGCIDCLGPDDEGLDS